MHRIEVELARDRLPELIEDALAGADIVITRDQRPLVRLVKARESEVRRRRPGTAKGLIEMRDDFDEPLEDFREYM